MEAHCAETAASRDATSLSQQTLFRTAWALSDGKAGDELQCVAVIEALGLTPDIRRVGPRAPWVWMAPWGPVGPGDRPDRDRSPIAGPFPDLLVASGRRAIPYARAVRRLSGGRTFTVILKDPRTGPATADFIWVPAHDPLRAPNVLATLTGPHRLSLERLAQARLHARSALTSLPAPRAAVLVGGDSRRHRFSDASIADFCQRLALLADSGVSLMVTASRRTPPGLAQAVRAIVARSAGYFWDGGDDNPYAEIMALADTVIVTTDSINMVGEAASTGKPVLTFSPSPDDRKTRFLLEGLRARGVVHDFTGTLAGNAYPPINSTADIASAIMDARARAIRPGSAPSDNRNI